MTLKKMVLLVGNEYSFINRDEMISGDSLGSNIIIEFLGDRWRYTPELPSSFSGIFSLSFDSSLAYTNRSQYLKNINLNGENNITIVGNNFPIEYMVIVAIIYSLAWV